MAKAERARALVIFDPEQARRWTGVGQERSIDWIFTAALNGADYPRERGVISIELLPADETAEEAEQRAEARGYRAAQDDITTWLRMIGKPKIAAAIYEGQHRRVVLQRMTMQQFDDMLKNAPTSSEAAEGDPPPLGI